MAEVHVSGVGQNDNVDWQIDATFQAGRVAIKPGEYQTPGSAVQGGHYKVGFMGGSLPGALTAPNQLLSIRWADSARVCVVERLTLGILCTAFSSGISLDVALYRATGFTANSSGAGSTTPTPAKCRVNMPASQFLNAGEFRVHGSAALTAGTQTLDASPMAYWIAQLTAVQQATQTDFLRRIELSGHPVVLAATEGLVLRLETLNLPVSNTIRLFGMAEIIETPVF